MHDTVTIHGLFGGQALDRLMEYPGPMRIIDIGSGAGIHADIMRGKGHSITTISMTGRADVIGDYMNYRPAFPVDAIWACHVLEHMPNVGLFLKKCFTDLREDGVLAVTVPPAKLNLVGGHLTLWTHALLLYNLIVAGFDCRNARVSDIYANTPSQPPYNISVIVKKREALLPKLLCDAGDIEQLERFFPCPVWQNMDGRFPAINW